jgi:hypothetical protein
MVFDMGSQKSGSTKVNKSLLRLVDDVVVEDEEQH